MDVSTAAQGFAALADPNVGGARKKDPNEKEQVSRKQLASALDAPRHAERAADQPREEDKDRGHNLDIEA